MANCLIALISCFALNKLNQEERWAEYDIHDARFNACIK